MTTAQHFFQLMYQYRSLRIPERMHLLPRGEHMILELLRTRELEGDTSTTLNAACMARHMHVSAPAVSRTMRHLRERGLIESEPDPNDRRGIRARITDTGHAELKSDRMRMAEMLDHAFSRLSPGEIEQFLATFGRLLDSISAELDTYDASHKP